MTNQVALTSEVALVTGAGRGLGLEIAQRFLANGYRVAFAARKAPPDSALTDPNKSMHLRLDMTDQKQVAGAVEEVVRRWGRLDVLISNASILRLAKAGTADEPETIETAMRTNYVGPAHLATASIASAERLGHSLRVIYISSTGAIAPRSAFGSYAASKAAAEAYFISLRDEIRRDPIRRRQVFVTIVRPAFIRSDYAVDVQGAPEDGPTLEFMAALRNLSPTTSSEVADRVLSIAQAKRPPILTNVGGDGKVVALARRALPLAGYLLIQRATERTFQQRSRRRFAQPGQC
jgi:NAD(P)-dependent dehydrogenase (short-subunit alcohol dehydrogenase family)